MREYKFRAYNKNTKEMYKIGQITLEKGIWNYEPNDREYIGMSIPYQPSFILMQYTGLKDKYGEEIYEGDIVKSYFENGLGVENKCLIIYDEYLCAFMGQELRTKQQYLFNEGNPNKKDKQLKYTEVIGNIYDNPELLEEGE